MNIIVAKIKQVAKEANVSPSTVSRVFNNSAPVSEEKTKAVLKAAQKLDYQPSHFARGLKNKKTFVLGFIIPNILNPYYSQLTKNAEIFAQKNDFSLLLADSDDNIKREKFHLNKLIKRKVDGVLLSTVGGEITHIKKNLENDVPIVTVGRKLKDLKLSSIFVNNYNVGKIAANHLISLGHKSIGVIGGVDNISSCRERLRGFIDTLKKNNINFKEEFIVKGDFTIETGKKGIEYFQNNNKTNFPTAIFCLNDTIAIGSLKRAHQYNINIPKDLSIIGCDDTYISKLVSPELTTVKHPIKKMAKSAVETIINEINKYSNDITKLELPVNLIKRNTTAKLR